MVMEAPPRWRECDRFIYCRVNVAKALTGGLARLYVDPTGNNRCAARSLKRRPRGTQRPDSRFVNQDGAGARKSYASDGVSAPSAACAAASRAIGTRNGEHDT